MVERASARNPKVDEPLGELEQFEETEGSDIVKLLEELKPPLNVQISPDFQLKIMSQITQHSKKSLINMAQLKPFLWPFLLVSAFLLLQILAAFDVINQTFVYNIREYAGAIFKWQK